MPDVAVAQPRRGDFEDVTLAAGWPSRSRSRAGRLGRLRQRRPASTCTSAASISPRRRAFNSGERAEADPRNRGRLYHNRGRRHLRDVAGAAGVTNERCGKGVAWGDYDDDGRLDLFVSNMGQAAGSITTRATARFATSPPSSASRGADGQLRLLVLGLRQRRPARPLRQRQRGPLCRDGRRDSSAPSSAAPAARGSIATSGPTASATSPARSGSTGRGCRWGRTSATSTTTASSTSTWEPAGCRTRTWCPTCCSRTSTAGGSRT